MSASATGEASKLLSDLDQSSDEESQAGAPVPSTPWRWKLAVSTVSACILCGVGAAGALRAAAPQATPYHTAGRGSAFLAEWQTAGIDGVKVLQVLAQASETCENYPHIELLETRHSNLGGHGPDTGSEGIRYLAQMGGRGMSRKLVVDVHAGSSYNPENSFGNGLSSSRLPLVVTNRSIEELCGAGRCDKANSFGSINLHSGSAANVTFQFFDLDLRPVYLDEVSLTWFDLDHAGCEGGPSCEPEGVESVTPIGHLTAYISSSARLSYEFKGDRVSFVAGSRGEGADNPVNSRLLTQGQIDKAVTSVYEKVHEVTVTIGATASLNPQGRARYFFFDFVPSLLCAEMVKDWPEWTSALVNGTGDAPAPRLEDGSPTEPPRAAAAARFPLTPGGLRPWWWAACLLGLAGLACVACLAALVLGRRSPDARAMSRRKAEPVASEASDLDRPPNRTMPVPFLARPLGDEV